MRIPARIKKFWLRTWYIQATIAAPPVTLVAKLQAISDSFAGASVGGQTVLYASADGQTTQFAPPSLGNGLGPQGMAYLVQELIDRYDEATSELIAEGTASPTDLQIYMHMKDCLRAATEVRNRYTNLRTANASTLQ